MKKYQTNKNLTLTNGFTLIELLVVISIIGMLSTIVLAGLNVAKNKANDAKMLMEKRSVNTALQLYYSNVGDVPHLGNISPGGTAEESTLQNSPYYLNMNALVNAGALPKIPQSPSGTAYSYTYNPGLPAGDRAVFNAVLSNEDAGGELPGGGGVLPPAPNVTGNDITNTVSGMDITMEYNLDNAGYTTYNPINFGGVDLRGEHTLLVRIINPVSAVQTLTFTANGPQPDEPNVTGNDDTNTVTGMTTEMEYSSNGSIYIRYPYYFTNNFPGDQTLYVRVAAAGDNPASNPTVITFTANDNVPFTLDVKFTPPAAGTGKVSGTANSQPIVFNNGLMYCEDVNCSTTIGNIPIGGIVMLTHLSGSRTFDHWYGAGCSGNGDTCIFTNDGNGKIIRLYFK